MFDQGKINEDNINSTDEKGNTMLIAALANGHDEAVQERRFALLRAFILPAASLAVFGSCRRVPRFCWTRLRGCSSNSSARDRLGMARKKGQSLST